MRHAEKEASLTYLETLPSADRFYSAYLSEQHHAPRLRQLIIGTNYLGSSLMSEQDRTTILQVTPHKKLTTDPSYGEGAKDVTVIAHEMNAGIGTSTIRDKYLARIGPQVGRGSNPIKGAKATDLYTSLPTRRGHEWVPTTEIKLNRVLQEQGYYKQVVLRPVINQQSKPSIDMLFDQPMFESRLQPEHLARTYREYIHASEKVSIGPYVQQYDLPNVDTRTGQLTTERMAPGSHGQVAFAILHEMTSAPPIDPQAKAVRVIFNGDGINNFFSPQMVQFTAEEAGVVMVTTQRLKADIKGGIIGGEQLENGMIVPQILERAQAEEVGQLAAFNALGVDDAQLSELLPADIATRHTSGEQYFNTNTALLNDTLLRQFFHRVKAEMGEPLLYQAMMPDLMHNPKGNFQQLEGAMGSVLLNLNRFVTLDPTANRIWQEISKGKPFLRFINVDAEERDEYFTGTKYSPDHALFAESNQYVLDTHAWKIKNTRPGHIPSFGGDLVEKGYYSEVEHVRQAFGHLKTRNLDRLTVHGPGAFSNAELIGEVEMVFQYQGDSEDDIFDLNSPEARRQLGQDHGSHLRLENVRVVIDKAGTVSVEYLLP